MKVQQSNISFQPVTITLDSQHEVDTFMSLCQIAYNNSSSRSDEELRSQMDGNGWQSSSANC